MRSDQNAANSNDSPTSLSMLVARLIWALFGPLTLLLLLMSIASYGSGWLTGRNLTYWVVLVLTIGGRWFELRSGQATTLEGGPATPAHFRRYVSIAVPLAIALWAIANIYGNKAWTSA